MLRTNIPLYAGYASILAWGITLTGFIINGWTYWIGYGIMPLHIGAVYIHFRSYRKAKIETQKFLDIAKVMELPKKTFGQCTVCNKFCNRNYALINPRYREIFEEELADKGYRRGQWGIEPVCYSCAVRYSI